MEKISFVKMSGAGNDFIVIDKNINPAFIPGKDFVRKVCNRRNGIGADGLITIADSGEFDFNMEYFNADGSTGSLCGNGARCAIKFADLTKRIGKRSTRFLSNSVLYSGEVLEDGRIKFYFNDPQNLKLDIKIYAAGKAINAAYVDTGSPHVVINIKNLLQSPENKGPFFYDINEVPVFSIGREIRYLSEFAPGGTNVNFVDIAEGILYIRTYERGVEDETLACGTGSAAAAIVSYFLDKINPPVKLITRGGDELTVDFSVENNTVKNLSLTGPAKVTFTGEFSLKQFI